MSSNDWSEFPFLIAGDQGSAICFLHGFLGSKEDWMPVVRNLSREFCCVSFDLPGHGEFVTASTLPAFNDLSDLIENQRRRLGVKKWTVVGYSMGGRVALDYAFRYPDNISSLILESASPGIEDEAARNERIVSDSEWGKRLVNTEPFDFLLQWYNQRTFTSLTNKESLTRQLMKQRSNYSAAHMAQVLKLWGQGTTGPMWDSLKNSKFPVLAIAGNEDEVYCTHIERMNGISPQVTGVVVENAGHTVHLEQPEQLARLIKNFIKDGAYK